MYDGCNWIDFNDETLCINYKQFVCLFRQTHSLQKTDSVQNFKFFKFCTKSVLLKNVSA